MKSPAERPYEKAHGSKYQSQIGPVVSRIGNDER
jgi:deoxycytidine triphosphate deaminase